jgi:hypothetical protein
MKTLSSQRSIVDWPGGWLGFPGGLSGLPQCGQNRVPGNVQPPQLEQGGDCGLDEPSLPVAKSTSKTTISSPGKPQIAPIIKSSKGPGIPMIHLVQFAG